ncbi:MAG: DMT family transporter [Treponema sp.]|jgi:drug/metabolite transporter (DMT)-like permease|nr:DMT family transporter [Treponema sp.]
MTERHKALLAIIACVLFWGFSFISIKVVVSVFPPMTLGALRFALAMAFLLFIKRRSLPKEKLKLRDFPGLLGAGLIGVTLYFFCENNGVALVSASEASIIVSTIPVLTMAAEWLGEKFSRSRRRPGGDPAAPGPGRITGRRWLGALISMAGVILVARVSFSISGNILGYLYMAGAALSWVAYCFLTRPLFARCSRTHIVFWQSAFGFIGFLPFAVLEFPRWGRPDPSLLIHLAFLGICCSALGYGYYARSLEILGVSVSSIFINFIPVVTVIAGFFFLGDRLTPAQWIGAALVLSGIYLAMVERAPKRDTIK